ncbi:hypothetical protein D9Q98_000660 [Chlorella vulgaris]|uniref:Uncharacterized protein n=1 Tax=Chlorella vulgaris TaxID=3077 RepID=A0A9D4TYR0_CHLVU|nr:hypothetical protein D9Q98_000660 [Chlorella vulgaris]
MATSVFNLHPVVRYEASLPGRPRHPHRQGTRYAARWSLQRGNLAAQAGRQDEPPPLQESDGKTPHSPSPQEALLAALQESGVPLEQIQVGRAPGDSEVWTDLLDAETEDVWMRDPPMPEYIEELLGGDLSGGSSSAGNNDDPPPPGGGS